MRIKVSVEGHDADTVRLQHGEVIQTGQMVRVQEQLELQSVSGTFRTNE